MADNDRFTRLMELKQALEQPGAGVCVLYKKGSYAGSVAKADIRTTKTETVLDLYLDTGRGSLSAFIVRENTVPSVKSYGGDIVINLEHEDQAGPQLADLRKCVRHGAQIHTFTMPVIGKDNNLIDQAEYCTRCYVEFLDRSIGRLR